MFTTERLHLRALQGPEDAATLLKLWNNINIGPMITDWAVAPMGPKFKDRIAGMAESMLLFLVVEEVETGKIAGMVGFFNQADARNRTANFAIGLFEEFWGKGYGTEATRFVIDHGFRHMGLHRISISAYGWNERAIKIYRKIGFVDEGCDRRSLWWDGKWWDGVRLGMLEEEWDLLEKQKKST